ncbi:hypothetical protein LCGC14_2205370 [marine sediment metagenome]|uniref:Uncharacterized protein n=1 Tax=marine sediment metagenome TaxID=412755 RepID=A0A0F9DFC8_9ZZZZ
MPEKYTLKFDYKLKDFFEKYLQKHPKLEFNNVAEYLKDHIISLKNDLERKLYNLKINKEIIEFFENYVKNNPNLGFINADELIRELIRHKAAELKQIKQKQPY